MRARYVAGESGVANFALVAEKSRARNSLVQQWAARGVRMAALHRLRKQLPNVRLCLPLCVQANLPRALAAVEASKSKL